MDTLERLDNVEYFPDWKKNASAVERLAEVDIMARKHPERFERMVIVWQGQRDGRFTTNHVTVNCDTVQALGVLELCKYDIQEFTRGQIHD